MEGTKQRNVDKTYTIKPCKRGYEADLMVWVGDGKSGWKRDRKIYSKDFDRLKQRAKQWVEEKHEPS